MGQQALVSERALYTEPRFWFIIVGLCDAGHGCATQDAKLAIVWNAGVFAVNFGPAILGLALDIIGPRVLASAGAGITAIGILITGLGLSSPTALLPLGACLIGFGGLSYHMAQFSAAALFPSKRGLVSSLYVGGFIASGIVWEVVRALFTALGEEVATYRAIMVGHAALVAPMVVLMAWMAPNKPFKSGEILTFERWCFRVNAPVDCGSPDAMEGELTTEATLGPDTASAIDGEGLSTQSDVKFLASVKAAIGTQAVCVDSDDGEERTSSNAVKHKHTSVAFGALSEQEPGVAESACSKTRMELEKADNVLSISRCISDKPFTTKACQSYIGDQADKEGQRQGGRPVHGRWMRLAAQPLAKQLKAPDFYALCIFFALNALVLQFYLGTARVQLDGLGDSNQVYVRVLSFMVPGISILAPLNGRLLDTLGYGKTLVLTNSLSLGTAVLQMVPILQLQVLTALLWAMARYLLYSSYFTIAGALFSYRNFGRVVGLISAVAGLLALLQLPLSDLTIDTWDGYFIPVQVIGAAMIIPLFIPAFLMLRWEHSES